MTEEEKDALTQRLVNHVGRAGIVEMLEAIGIACYDDETTEELAEAAVDSIESGDIESPV